MCFIRVVNVYGYMSHSSVFPGREILVGAHPIYINHLIFVIDELNSIKTLCLMCCLCDIFLLRLMLNLLGWLLIGTNDDLIFRDITYSK